MENKKAYFMDNATHDLYELSASKRKQLEKNHPKWFNYDLDRNNKELSDVEEFFKKNGKLLTRQSWRNVFVGLTV
jgi:phage-related protein